MSRSNNHSNREIQDNNDAAKLRENELWYRTIFENTGTATIIIEENLVISLANAEFSNLTGYSKDDIQGKMRWTEFVVKDDLNRMLAQHRLRRQNQTGALRNYEFRLLRRDGKKRDIFLTVDFIPGTNCSIASLLDVTERNQFEEALRKLSMAVEHSPESIVITDTSGKIEYVNPRFTEVTGYTLNEAIGQNPSVLKSGKTPESTYKELWETILAGFEWRGEFLNKKKNGELYWESASISPVKDDLGRITHFVAVKLDITDRKRAELALADSREYLDRIINSVADPIFVKDRQHRWVLLNDALCAFIGHTREELLGKSDYDFFPARQADMYWAKDEHVYETGEENVNEEQLTDAMGVLHTIITKKTLFTDKSGHVFLVGIIRDITDRKQAEDALKQSEEKYRNMVENVNDVIFSISSSGIITYMSPSIERISGFNLDEIVGQPFSRFVHQEDMPGLQASFLRTMQGDNISAEFRVFRKDGSVVYVRTSSKVLVEGNRLIGLTGIMSDITKRKHAEEALRLKNEELNSANQEITLAEEKLRQQYMMLIGREKDLADSEAKLNTLLYNSPIPIFAIGMDHKVIYWSKAMESYSGLKAADIVGTDQQWKAFYPAERPCVIDLVVDNSTAELDTWYPGKYCISRMVEDAYEVTDYFPSIGKWLHCIAIAILDREGRMIGGVELFDDVTDNKKAEEQIKASLREKETLLKEIHHRVKNNLQIISSLLSLQSVYDSDTDIRIGLKESQNRIKSMAQIHEKLYHSKNLAEIDLSEYIRSLSDFLYSTYISDRGRIELVQDVEKVTIGIDRAIPCGLIINELITNSLKHAFPGNRPGKLIVKLRLIDGGNIQITISDDGIGLPKDLDMKNTRTLGMQLISTLIDQIEGTIEVNRDNGTTFEITFNDLTQKVHD